MAAQARMAADRLEISGTAKRPSRYVGDRATRERGSKG